MWKIEQDTESGRWGLIHENGKRATGVLFHTPEKAQLTANLYNENNLGFCPDCGITQYENRFCTSCAQSKLEKEGVEILKGRFARCYCKKQVPSEKCATEKVYAFFTYHPDLEFDSYYCGCRGWD